MKLLTLTHANHKKPIYVDGALLFAWYYSEAHKATHIVSTAGAILPVSESVETVTQLKQGESVNNGQPESERRTVRSRRTGSR